MDGGRLVERHLELDVGRDGAQERNVFVVCVEIGGLVRADAHKMEDAHLAEEGKQRADVGEDVLRLFKIMIAAVRFVEIADEHLFGVVFGRRPRKRGMCDQMPMRPYTVISPRMP